MKNTKIKFFPSFPLNGFDALANIVDDRVTDVYIPTSKGWKCKRKGCTLDVKHTHSTYSILK